MTGVWRALGGDGADNGVLWALGAGALPEIFDLATLNAVLAEWGKAAVSLPAFAQAALESGAASSAQVYRLLLAESRPSLMRSALRGLPEGAQRALAGRLLADPAFLHKLAFEQALTAGFSVHSEIQKRGEDFRDELGLVAANTLALCAANAALVWLVAPARVFGGSSLLDRLPNNAFQRAGPLHQYTAGSRAAGLLVRGAQAGAVGAAAGGAAALAGRAAENSMEYEASVPAPAPAEGALSLAGFLALSAHLRYQALGGLDRFLSFGCGNSRLALAASLGARVVNQGVGTMGPLVPFPGSRADAGESDVDETDSEEGRLAVA